MPSCIEWVSLSILFFTGSSDVAILSISLSSSWNKLLFALCTRGGLQNETEKEADHLVNVVNQQVIILTSPAETMDGFLYFSEW